MRVWIVRRRFPLAFIVVAVLFGSLVVGCKMISDRLSHWQMLDQQALEDPIKAVGGDAVVFAPEGDDAPQDVNRLVKASPQDLVAYYSPVFIQQRVNTAAQPHPYPPEYDQIGQACLRRDKGGLKAFVAGSPIVYAIYQKLPIGGHDHVQLTFTAWYPAHPRMKTIDLEEADIDSCVVRVTLDERNAPLFFETIAACGCFHKVFVEKRVEDAAANAFGPPEQGKKYAVERTLKDAIDWEVAGVVDEPSDRPRRPVVFVKAGDHKVLGLGSAARLRVPAGADVHPYALTDYRDLYSIQIADSQEQQAHSSTWVKAARCGARSARSGSSSAWSASIRPASRGPTTRSRCTSTKAPGATRPPTNASCACRPGRFDAWGRLVGEPVTLARRRLNVRGARFAASPTRKSKHESLSATSRPTNRRPARVASAGNRSSPGVFHADGLHGSPQSGTSGDDSVQRNGLDGSVRAGPSRG